MKSALDHVVAALKAGRGKRKGKRVRYAIPSLWIPSAKGRQPVRIDPFGFYLDAVRRIRKTKRAKRIAGPGGEWTRRAVVYNMLVRTTTAFDHNENGRLDLPVNADGFRETGTFLKSIALLPYLRRLGVNTIHLLPVTSIGQDGNKGNLGSPYAIRNPFELDEALSEPVLGLDPGIQFRAFVEAAHHLGMRVVVEFVFRTAAKDSDWIMHHPEWFYWIREEIGLREHSTMDERKYGSPIFDKDELERIHQDVGAGRRDQLTPPHQIYREFFTVPPARVEKLNGRYTGWLADGRRAKIPGAFADWPPDDNQPPWGDVTYLKLYEHPDFNYIGYNTIRMYDSRLAREEHRNQPLWDTIAGIIPFYQKEFSIDGVMIDMGHALPMDLKRRMIREAREIDPDFVFWDENFSVTAQTRQEGYNAVVGYLWLDEHHPTRMHTYLRRCGGSGFPISYFGTAETHNTPRAASRPGGSAFARWSLVVNAFIPAVLFIHSGFELGERFPINTGLDFTQKDQQNLPSEKLPLFSAYAFDWSCRHQFADDIAQVTAIRKKFESVVTDTDPATFHSLDGGDELVLAFARASGKQRIAVVTNADFQGPRTATISLDTRKTHVRDLLSEKTIPVRHGVVRKKLRAGQCLVFEF